MLKGDTSIKKFICIVQTGHVGSGRSAERTLLVTARDAVEALNKAKRYPGVKKAPSFQAAGACC